LEDAREPEVPAAACVFAVPDDLVLDELPEALQLILGWEGHPHYVGPLIISSLVASAPCALPGGAVAPFLARKSFGAAAARPLAGLAAMGLVR
jgi:hypothetical protein